MLDNIQMIGSKLAKYIAVLSLSACSAQGVSAQSDSKLVEQLRSDYAALLDARVDFEQFEADPDSYTPEQADYADWVQQLNKQFAGRCNELSNQAPELIPADIPCAEFSQVYSAPANIDIEQESSDAEQQATGEGAFEKSLGEFDEKLLRDQDRVKARRPQSAAADSGGAGGGASGGGEEGAGQAEGGSTEGGQEGQQSDEQGSAVGAGNEQADQGAKGSSSSSAPPGTPDGSDDDVIARQLREAAEKETDPELKRKLWEEYKRYKEGI